MGQTPSSPSRLGPLALWNHAARLVEYAALYVGSVIIARGLGVDLNGQYALLLSLAQAILVLGSLGADATLNRHIPQFQGPDADPQIRFIFRRVALLRIAAVLAAGLALWGLAGLWPETLSARIPEYLLILLAYGAVRALVQLFNVSLLARFQAVVNARIVVVTRLAELAGILILAESGITIGGVFALLTGTGLLQIGAYVAASSGLVAGTTRPLPLAPILGFGMVFWLNSLVDYFLGKFGDVFLLTLILGETSAASLYDISYSLTQAVLLAATVGFAGLSFARFSRLAREGRGEMNRFYISLVRTISFLTIPAFAFLLVHAASLIAIIYSPAYGSAAVLLQTMAGFRIASRLFAGGENAEYLLSRGRVAPLVAIGVLAAGVNVGLDILLIPAMRAEGAAIAGGSANLLVNGLGWFLVRKEGGPRLQGAFWLKLALMSAVCAGVSYILLDGMLVVQAVLYILLLGAASFALKPFGAGDIDLLRSVHPRLARMARPFARAEANLEQE